MEDLPGEIFIYAIDRDCLVLGNVRVQHMAGNLYKSIRLEDITFIDYVRKYKMWILYRTLIACFVIISVCYFFGNSDYGFKNGLILSVFVFAIGLIIFELSQEKILYFGSAGGGIGIVADHLHDSDIARFIKLTEREIHKIKGGTSTASSKEAASPLKD